MKHCVFLVGGLALLLGGCMRLGFRAGDDAGGATDGAFGEAALRDGPLDAATAEAAHPESDGPPRDASSGDLPQPVPDITQLVPDKGVAPADLPKPVPDIIQLVPDKGVAPDLPQQVPDSLVPQGPVAAAGGTGDDKGWIIALDGTGLYLGATFSDTIVVGGYKLTSQGGTDILLARYSAAGQLIWVRSDGGPKDDHPGGLALDKSGNLHVIGTFSDTASIAGKPFTAVGNSDIFLACFDAQGTPLWAKAFGTTQAEWGSDIVVDGNDNLQIVGTGGDGIDMGGGKLSANSLVDVLVASFTSGGAHRRSALYGSGKADSGQAIVADASGQIYITGSSLDAADFGGGPPLPFVGVVDLFLACFSDGGVHQWSKAFGSAGIDNGLDLALDGKGNLYLAGYYAGPISFGGSHSLTHSGGYDGFVASFTVKGNTNWVQSAGGTGDDIAHSVTVDSAGNVVTAGSFTGKAGVAQGSLVSLGGTDAFLVSLTPAGTFRWAAGHGGALADGAYQVRRSPTLLPGTLFVTGFFSDTALVGGQKLVSTGGTDIFVAQQNEN